MVSRSRLMTAALALTLAAATPAHATRFDVIYADHFDLTLCEGCGITLAGADFALFVNRSTTSIDLPTFNSIEYTVVSSVPDLHLRPYAFSPGPSIMPIEQNEAVGNISAQYPQNSILLTQLLPFEVFHDAGSTGTLGFTVERHGAYEGPVTCTITMKLGQDVATFDIHFDYHLGPHNIVFLSAKTAHAHPLPVAVGRGAAQTETTLPAATARTSWGAIKALYR